MAKILICEDDIDFYTVLSATLRSKGHEVFLAGDAQNILSVLRAHMPEVIVLDMQIPGGGAPQVIKDIEASPTYAALPLVFISGMPLQHLKKWFVETPNRRFITKPFEAARLEAVIRELLGQER